MFPTGELHYQEFLPKTTPGPQMWARLQWSLRGGPLVLGELPEGEEGRVPGCVVSFLGVQVRRHFHPDDSLARVRLGRRCAGTFIRTTH